MRRHATLGAAVLVGSLALAGAAAGGAERDVVLRDVEVALSEGRFVLSTAAGDTYELAGLETPATCPAGRGRTWACGVGAREALAAGVAGEALQCRVLDEGAPPAVECFAQTRNLNAWMLHVGRAKLQPAWRGRIPEYDEAELSARSAKAMVWHESPSDPLTLRPAIGLQAAGRTTAGTFLLRRQDGDVRTYVLAPLSNGAPVVLEYGAIEASLDRDLVPALGAGDVLVHHARGGELAYAWAPPAAGEHPLAYVVGNEDVEGRSRADLTLDGMTWTSRRGALQPRQVPLWAVIERRGATAAERSTIASGAHDDTLRAGVWTVDALRIVVAEDAFGCVRSTWCRFAVLDDGGVVVSGTARDAPAFPAADARTPVSAAEAAKNGLVWQSPAGDWRRWMR